MKILYIGSFRLPDGDAAAQRVINNAKLMRELGCEVDFISFGGNGDNGEVENFRYVVSHDLDINWHNIYSKLKSIIRKGYRASNIIGDIIDKYDVLVMYNPSGYLVKKMMSLCQRKSIKLISDVTEWYSVNDFPKGKLNPFYWKYQFDERFVLPRVKNVIPISTYLFAHYSKSPNRIILPPLVDILEKKWSQESIKKDVFSGKTIIYAGSLGNKKDRLDVFLDALEGAIRKGANLHLMILGGSVISYSSEEQRQFLSKYVRILGKVSQKDVPRYYKLADFSVLIRDNNRKSNAGFSTKLVESIVSGVIPIVNVTSDIDKYLENNKNALILNSISVSDIENKLLIINKMSNDRLEMMHKEVRNVALKFFDYRVYKENMKCFLEKLV